MALPQRSQERYLSYFQSATR